MNLFSVEKRLLPTPSNKDPTMTTINYTDDFNQLCEQGDKAKTLAFLQDNLAEMATNLKSMNDIIILNPVKQDMCEVVLYLYKKGSVLDDCLCAWAPTLKMLKLLRSFGCTWDERLFNYLGASGKKNHDINEIEAIIKHAREDRYYVCSWGTMAYECAFIHKRPDIVKLLHTYGCPWKSITLYKAYEYGQVEALRYLLEHGVPWGYPYISEQITPYNYDVWEELDAIVQPYADKYKET